MAGAGTMRPTTGAGGEQGNAGAAKELRQSSVGQSRCCCSVCACSHQSDAAARHVELCRGVVSAHPHHTGATHDFASKNVEQTLLGYT